MPTARQQGMRNARPSLELSSVLREEQVQLQELRIEHNHADVDHEFVPLINNACVLFALRSTHKSAINLK